MNKNIIYILLAVVVLVVVWFLIDSPTHNDETAPVPTLLSTVSPVPSVSVQSSESFEQELDSLLQGSVENEFKSVDGDIQNL